jgi:nitrogen-specific signal transduction histidine kinase
MCTCLLFLSIWLLAAMGVRQQRRQKMLAEHASAAAMANDLAHKINNPLQSLTDIPYLAAEGHSGKDAMAVGRQAFADLEKLSALVKKLLGLRYSKTE